MHNQFSPSVVIDTYLSLNTSANSIDNAFHDTAVDLGDIGNHVESNTFALTDSDVVSNVYALTNNDVPSDDVITFAYSDVIHTDDSSIEVIHNNIVLIKNNQNGIPYPKFPAWNDNDSDDEYDDDEDADNHFNF